MMTDHSCFLSIMSALPQPFDHVYLKKGVIDCASEPHDSNPPDLLPLLSSMPLPVMLCAKLPFVQTFPPHKHGCVRTPQSILGNLSVVRPHDWSKWKHSLPRACSQFDVVYNSITIRNYKCNYTTYKSLHGRSQLQLWNPIKMRLQTYNGTIGLKFHFPW